ncbi:UvrD-helicase domain-containing protein [Novosphingobium sp. B 225]|uniref:UvrD-helicase domain-containing protein n=1 Tax=Novosphingobium sp. B 225 TaxID=1961849 RepID=UPI000B4B4BBB|nr:UvrD-helicase domain-containing protein [Novosphingobium sp. B 225]
MIGRNRIFKPNFWARLFRLQNWKLVMNSSVRDRISCFSDGAFDLPCIEISAVSTTKGLLWHTVEIRTNEQTHRFSGLGATVASEIAQEALAFINRHLSILIEQNKGQLFSVDERIRAITEDSRQYLAHADIAKAISQVPGDASKALSHPLFNPALMPGSLQKDLPKSFEILTDPRVRHRYNEIFVVTELERFSSFFDDLGGFCLSKEQREACIRLEDNNLLVASAGSGKSATMVGKVSYALEKNLYEPNQILVLAFNRSAADELKERISRQLQVEEEDLQCRVTTFHALGRGIIEETEGRPPQLANWVEHPAGEARVIDQLIKDLMVNDADYRFAGSDITIFTQFESNFGACWQGRLEQTYRCNQLIAETAAKFVQRNPEQIKKTVRSTRPAIARSIRIVPVSVEWKKPSFDEACHILLSRLDAFLEGVCEQWRTDPGQKLKVLVLWRYNHLDPFKAHKPDYANIEVSGLSFHRAKGLEADYTILLDVSEGDYGVPSRIEDDELLNLVIPRPETYSYAEERRLFYVALTRASRGTFLLANDRKPSRYIRELCEIAGENVRFETVEGGPQAPCLH